MCAKSPLILGSLKRHSKFSECHSRTHKVTLSHLKFFDEWGLAHFFLEISTKSLPLNPSDVLERFRFAQNRQKQQGLDRFRVF